VGALPHDYTEADFRHLFRDYGPITKADLRVGMGWGFLAFADERAAANAQRDLHRQKFDGRVLQVEFRRELPAGKGGKGQGKGQGKGDPRDGREERDGGASGSSGPRSNNLEEHQRLLADGRPKNWRVLVEGLPRSCGWQELKDWARNCGVLPVFALTVEGGLGVLDFPSKREFTAAIQQLPRRPLGGNEVQVFPCRWQPEGESPRRGRKRSRSRSRTPSRSFSRSPDRGAGPRQFNGARGGPRPPPRRVGPTGDPGPGYVCHSCRQPGHWRQNCPSRSTAVARRSRSRSRSQPGSPKRCRPGSPGHVRTNPAAAGNAAAAAALMGGPHPQSSAPPAAKVNRGVHDADAVSG